MIRKAWNLYKTNKEYIKVRERYRHMFYMWSNDLVHPSNREEVLNTLQELSKEMERLKGELLK